MTCVVMRPRLIFSAAAREDHRKSGVTMMMSATRISLLLLVPCAVSGFLLGQRPFAMSHHQGAPRHPSSRVPATTTRLATTPSSSTAEQQAALKETARNIFHDYDKPIVLLGCSGAGNELYRLAESLLSAHFAATVADKLQQTDGDGRSGSVSASPPSTTDAIVKLSTKDSGGSLALLSKEALTRDIEEKRYKWPNIIVVDLNDPLFGLEDGKYADKLESHYVDVAQSLYEIGMLSVYVNVDPFHSDMSKVAADRKAQLEEKVFVKYSDYEICIREEGLLDPSSLSAVEPPKENSSDEVEKCEEDHSPEERQEQAWEHIEWELARVLARARLIPAVPGDKTRSSNTAYLTMGENTFFLSLSFPDITRVEPYVESMCQDVDAMEYRADLLDCRDSRFDLLYGMQLLRRYCRPHTTRVPALPFSGTVIEDVMPIVYTVRTQNQAGTYPDDEAGIANMFKLLEVGLRGGVEVLDVESAWDAGKTADLLDKAEERYSSQILGSHHVVDGEISLEDAVLLYQQCALNGRAHGAKVVLSIDSDEKDRMAYQAALIASELAASEGKPVIPKISLILGDVGQFSRVINLPFTPVTHESFPFKAAPGQMTANEIMTTRLLTKIFTSKKFAILGHNIAYSVSPQMHGAAFAATRLPHEYVRADVATVEEFVESDFFKSDDFGGTSVTIPHKQAIMPHVDVLSDAAKQIGSVNTLIVKEEFGDDEFKRVVYGDNTDWRGMFNPLDRLLGGQVNPNSDYVLILGAGGTARAAAYVGAKLGLQRIYYNRTPSKAEELAKSFGGEVVTSLKEASEGGGMSLADVLGPDTAVRVVISTLPAAVEFVLPEWLVRNKPVVFDVNYKPYNTKLLLQAESLGCKVVRGSEMLWEQGVGQFELWTGRTAPYHVMKSVVLQNCREDI